MSDYKAENLNEKLTPEDSLMNKDNDFKDTEIKFDNLSIFNINDL